LEDATTGSQGGPTPDGPRSYFERGLKSARLGFPDQAVKDFEEAAWLDPDNFEVQFNLGTAYLSMGMFEQAVSNLTRALALRPDAADAWGNRAVAWAAIGDDGRSAEDAAEAARHGGNPDGLAAVIEYVKGRRKPRLGLDV
jgi:tetratricopeptide (TPR) repeat protein